ncbi:BrnT family toxin [Chloroflexales bacterium ZM16-3]|nr:BrnT family toxin [Chloroflexales bacterium ZM16-3]
MEFEWDNRKAAYNLSKHGVAFSEAATVFYDPLAVTFADPDHSTTEDRWIVLGTSDAGRLLFVSHTDRVDRIRIISARTAKPRERRLYESENPDTA